MVHFQDGLLHRHPLHAGLQLVIEDQPRGIEILVVGPQGQHKVTELPLRRFPGHFLTGLEGFTHIGQIELCRVVCDVCQGHIGIQELQGILLLGRDAPGKGHKRLQGAIVGFQTGLIVLYIILFVGAREQQQAQGAKAKQCFFHM